jgi:fatty-acyl-CoA synthase
MHAKEITICYGMTETSPVSFQSATDDPIDRRVSTIGRVHPQVEAKIVDAQGNIVPPGVPGEVCCRGYSVMLGYWDDEAKTRESIKDGWMHTGDLGVIDAEGYASIVGRLKDMVIRGGENIYPREVEEFLLQNPKFREVQVFGVPDKHYGEELCAWIVCREGQTATEEEVRAFCKDRISHYKIPKYIRFRAELPLTATGKAQKFKMRDDMIKELGLTP